jgi:hypothetical protein
VRILSVSDEHQEHILRRRAACVAKIARQRDQLEAEFMRLRAPLRTFEIGMQVGSGLRRHATVISMVLLPLLGLAGRRLASGAGALLRLGRKAPRWWSFWKVGSAVVAGWGKGRRR